MSQDHIDLVRSAYEAYNRRDVEAVFARFDSQIDWDVPDSLPWGAHVRGIEGLGPFFEGLAAYTMARATRDGAGLGLTRSRGRRGARPGPAASRRCARPTSRAGRPRRSRRPSRGP